MRTIYRTAPELVVGTFTETTGEDITECPVQVGLSTSDKVPPTTWVAPTTEVRPTVASAKVGLLVTNAVAAGTYCLWVKVVDGTETLVRPARNELIHVI